MIQQKATTMIHFTQRAIEWTKTLRESMASSKRSGLRIAVTGGGICAGYEYFVGFEDEPAEEDLRIAVDDFMVYIDPESFKEVEGGRVDFQDTPQGSGFVVTISEKRKTEHVCCCAKEGVLSDEDKEQRGEEKAELRRQRKATQEAPQETTHETTLKVSRVPNRKVHRISV